MCTASWSVGREPGTLCFNRDERKNRPRALPPRLLLRDGVRIVAPTDPVGGGTWICVSEFGLCAYLLNNYEAAAKAAARVVAPKSRGLVPLTLSVERTVDAAAARLQSEDLAPYPPFLVGLWDGLQSRAFGWDGNRLEERVLETPLLTTSSFRSQEVQMYRKRRYEELLSDKDRFSSETQRNFHIEQNHADAAFDPLMLRAESETHNVSTVVLGAKEIQFRYEAVASERRELQEAVVCKIDRI